MKRARLLLLLLPLVAGAFYLRSLASWRPKVVFTGAGPIRHFVFSNDGKTVLVEHATQQMTMTSALVAPLIIVTALGTQEGFIPQWQRNEGLPDGRSTTQFFASDSRVLAYETGIQILDARTGKTLKYYGQIMGEAAMSPDGKWLALNRGDDLFVNPKAARDDDVRAHVDIRAEGIRAQKLIKDAHSQPCFSPDGKTFVTGTLKGRLDFYDTKTWKGTKSWNAPSPGGKPLYRRSYFKVQWSRDGKFIFCSWAGIGRGGVEVEQALWRVSDGKKIATSPSGDQYQELQSGGAVLFYSGKGPVFLRTAPNLSSGGKTLLQLPHELITTAALSPDGSYLMAGTESGRVYYQRVK